jgi:hypothetical protein
MADDSSSERSGRRNAIFAFHAAGTRGLSPLVVTVEHRDAGDGMWSAVRSAPISADGTTTLRVDGLKEEWRVRLAGDGGGVRVLMAPPKWLPG